MDTNCCNPKSPDPLTNFYSTFDAIQFIDASVDYDGFCDSIKENDKRRSVASFSDEVACIYRTNCILL